jgi:hypothetical protein
MSAFGGNTMNFGLRISAADDTRTGLRSALASVQGFARSALKPITIPIQIARGGLGLLRDINLGLAPLVRGLDSIIERGSAVANSIVKAASGTITMARGMQIANRAMASGMSLDQLNTAVEFISKFSVAIGKDAGEALNTVITGLSRGSTLFLDDFGILVNGVEQVARDFDAIKGSGAFEQLGPAAQKAEIVRQAIAEMSARTKDIGVSGRETIFVWQSLKNTISDGVDGLVMTISKSGALKSVLTGVRDVLSGVNEHFKKGGTFAELFFGKGDSGGILGLAKGAMVDAGSALGRGMLGGLLKGIGAMPDLFDKVWGKIEEKWDWAMGKLKETLVASVDEAMNIVESRLFPKAAGLKQFEGMGESSPVARIMSLLFSQGDAKSGWVEPGLDDPMMFGAIKLFRALDWLGFVDKGGASATSQPASRTPGPGNWYYPLNSPAKTRLFRSFFDMANDMGDRVLSGGIYGGDSALLREMGAWPKAFPGVWNGPSAAQGIQPIGRYSLTQGARDSRMRRARVLENQLRNIEAGGDFARQNALRESGEQIRGLLRQGYHLSPGDRRELFEQALERQINSRRGEVEAKLEQLYGELNGSDGRRAFEADHARMKNAARIGSADAETAAAVRAIGAKIDQFVSGVSAILQKLTGEEIKLANAQGRAA